MKIESFKFEIFRKFDKSQRVVLVFIYLQLKINSVILWLKDISCKKVDGVINI